MIDTKQNLTVLLDDNGVFTDYTIEAASYLRDDISVSLVSAEDYIYVGYKKPINSLYIDLSTVAAQGAINVEYYNGSWTSVSGLFDDSRGFSRNGFISWNRDLVNDQETTVNSQTMYWYRLKPDANATIVLTGLNLVFNDLQDLKEECYEVDINADLTPTVSYYVNAKNEILQRLSNIGAFKQDSYTLYRSRMTQWDLLDIPEVKRASVMYCMAKWYFHLSDAPEDVYDQKHQYYYSQFEELISRLRVSLDFNDNGKTQSNEILPESRTRKFSR